MKNTRQITANRVFSSTVLFFLLFSAGAHLFAQNEDPWPMYRHDARQSARTSFAGPLSTPLVLEEFGSWHEDVPNPLWVVAINSQNAIFLRRFSIDESILTAVNTDAWRYPVDIHPNTFPALASDGTVFFITLNNELAAANSQGVIQWTYNTNGGRAPIISPDGGTVYVVSDKLYAISADGQLRWTYNTEGGAPPAISRDDVIFVASQKLYAIRANGALKWHYNIQCNSGPAIDDDGDIFVSSDESLYSFGSEGALKWNYPCQGASFALGSDKMIYALAGGRLFAISKDGALEWERDVGNVGDLFLDRYNTIYLSNSQGKIDAINTDGTLKWQYYLSGPTGGSGNLTAPLIGTDGSLYFGANPTQGIYYLMKLRSRINRAAATIHVPEEYATIQDAITNAVDGDTIIVAAGVYNISTTILNDNINNLYIIGAGARHGGLSSTVVPAANAGTFNCFTFRNVVGCKLAGFEVKGGSSGIVMDSCRSCTITQNYIHDNDELHSWHGEGVGIHNSKDIDITFCVLDSNEFHGIGIDQSENIRILNNTIVNTLSYDGIAFSANSRDIVIMNNIFAYGKEEGIQYSGAVVGLVIDYNCFWHNGKMPVNPPPMGLHSFEKDPLFIDAANHNYCLHYNSPCLGAGKGGANIGALDAGFSIASIADVKNDQGGQVRVVWDKIFYDGGGDYKISKYCLWRRVEAGTQAAPPSAVDLKKASCFSEMLKDAAGSGRPARYFIKQGKSSGGELWDFIASIPARHSYRYACIAPTLADSTAAGISWSVFFVSAHTQDPDIFFDCQPDSGYSVDNLAPSCPQGIEIIQEVVGGKRNVLISWNRIKDKDFAYYAVYRDTCAGFDAASMQAFATTIDTFFTDANLDSALTFYYKISAFDFSGNESEFSKELATAVKSRDSSGLLIPTAFSLSQNYPNPFNARTKINYKMPKACYIRLEIFDIMGQKVCSLVDASQKAGFYSLEWDGVNENNVSVAGGVYLLRMTAEDYRKTVKIVKVP